jgi:hypothetical protein
MVDCCIHPLVLLLIDLSIDCGEKEGERRVAYHTFGGNEVTSKDTFLTAVLISVTKSGL